MSRSVSPEQPRFMTGQKKSSRNPRSRKPRVPGILTDARRAVPERRLVSFRYGSVMNMLEAAVGAGVQQVWNLNSLYDPDATGVGHQPLYFDQMVTATGPYQRFRVLSVNVKFTVTNISADPVLFAFYFQPGALDFPSRELLIEKPECKPIYLPQSGGGPVTRTYSRTIPIEKCFGITRARLLADDVYSGLYNANPSQIALGVVMMYALPGSGVVAQVSVATELTFLAEVFGRSAIASS